MNGRVTSQHVKVLFNVPEIDINMQQLHKYEYMFLQCQQKKENNKVRILIKMILTKKTETCSGKCVIKKVECGFILSRSL